MRHILKRIAASLATALILTGSFTTPAHAASYWQIKSVRTGTCLYSYPDRVAGFALKPCSTAPVQYGRWSVTNVGSYNRHSLWQIRRHSADCLGVEGRTDDLDLYRWPCSALGSRVVWEVFSVGNGRIVLKSFGAFRTWGQHRCLDFTYSSPLLGACSLTSTTKQIYL
ncbi:hypothetical protein ACQP2X_39715 [Actinoplanes sp. CA-131856]